MKFEQFIENVTEAVKGEIPEVLKGEVHVGVHQVVKTNDELLHGLSLILPGQKSVPTIYLEDCYEEFKKGASIDEIAETIIRMSLDAYKSAPAFAEVSLEFDDIADKLMVQLIDGDLNRERLKELVHKPVGNGFVMIAYIVINEDHEGRMRTAVTKTMAEELKYDVDQLMDIAFMNTIENFPPLFTDLRRMCGSGRLPEITNPLDENFVINTHHNMYFLSNSGFQDGASALYYPFVAEKIGELLDDNYYVLPSSLNELIIVPQKAGLSLTDMKRMVKDANSTVVDHREILSEKVLLYDRQKNKLIENENYS